MPRSSATHLDRPLSPIEGRHRRGAGLLLGCLAFALFFPNPGWPIGNYTGLQIGQALTVVAMPILIRYGTNKRHLSAIAALVVPILISTTAWVIFLGAADNGIAIRTTIVYTLAV